MGRVNSSSAIRHVGELAKGQEARGKRQEARGKRQEARGRIASPHRPSGQISPLNPHKTGSVRVSVHIHTCGDIASFMRNGARETPTPHSRPIHIPLATPARSAHSILPVRTDQPTQSAPSRQIRPFNPHKTGSVRISVHIHTCGHIASFMRNGARETSTPHSRPIHIPLATPVRSLRATPARSLRATPALPLRATPVPAAAGRRRRRLRLRSG